MDLKNPIELSSEDRSRSWADLDVADISQKVEEAVKIPKEAEVPPAAEDDEAEPVIEIKELSGLIESVHNVEVKLADQQSDEKSPLFSVQSFEQLGLHESLLKGIYAMKFTKPSKVQERALPLLLRNPPENMIAQSQSGTGKTAAFVLTMLSRVDPNLPHSQAICLSPSRELARQIMDVCKAMGQFTNCTMAYALKESIASGSPPISDHIIIGTPGSVIELAKRRLINLSKIKVFVLDEADVMLDRQGMGDQSIRVKRLCPPTVQVLLFSATFKEEVREFAKRVTPKANELSLKREELSVEGIKQLYMDCKSDLHRYEILSHIYGLLTIGQSIIFVAKRDTAERVQAFMQKEGHLTSLLHGKMEVTDRDKVIDDFRSGKTKVLITTNVLARGIDILQVSLVINFDIPLDGNNRPDPETYLHRIGRTGRFGRSGVSINFVYDQSSLNHMLAIARFLGREIQKVATTDIESLENSLRDVQEQIDSVAKK